MNNTATAGAKAPALIYTRMSTKASWTEYFYDGECKVVQGRLENYKPHWAYELMANRGFAYEEPMPEAESTATEPTEAGQADEADAKPKRSKGAKHE